MDNVLPLLIPIIAVSIPLVVVAGRFVVQPITSAVLKLAESQAAAKNAAPLEQRLAYTEERLARLEKTLETLVEEQRFTRELLSSRSKDPALTGGSR
jgi:hypothetical protein